MGRTSEMLQEILCTPLAGYAVICLLAFALGICVTFLCIHWKSLKKERHGR